MFVSLTMSIWSQVTIDQKIDTMQILIGEQTKLTLSVTLDEKHHKVSFPKFERSQYITPGVEVLECSNIDTLGVEDNLINTASLIRLLHSTRNYIAFHHRA